MTAELDQALRRAAEHKEMCERVKQVIASRLELPIPAGWITDDQPLLGRGLELDSLDALELAMGIDAELGIHVYDDDAAMLGSVSSFVDQMVHRAETVKRSAS